MTAFSMRKSAIIAAIRFIRKNKQYFLPNARKYDIIISSSIAARQATP